MASELGVPHALAPGPAEQPRPSALTALRFPFEGPGAARRVIVMSLWQLVPVLGWIALAGWLSETSRRLCARHPEPVPSPSLRDFAYYLRVGWRPALTAYLAGTALALLTYAVLALFFLGGLAGMIASSGSVVPLLFILGALAELVLAAVGTVLASSAVTGLELGADPIDVLSGAWLGRYTRRTGVRALVGYALLAPALVVLLAAGALLCGVGLIPALVVAELSAVHLRWQLYEHSGRRGAVFEPRAPALLSSETRALPRSIEDRPQ
jgi:hypothetical protein